MDRFVPTLPDTAATLCAGEPWPEPRAAYIHVPFCIHRCGYCDFTLVARQDHLISRYLRGLQQDLARLEQPREVDTLFFGGGTPTYLPVDDLAELLRLVRQWFPLAAGAEFSVEANPAGLDAARLDVLAQAGVNRISLGVQSFDPQVLAVLERDHRLPDVLATWRNLQERFENLSLDLIFGVPGQTLELWQRTLHQALDLQPRHVSTYGLTYEKGTQFWSRREKGELSNLPDELERAMYAAALDDLESVGFEQYEISSFARPGARCRHNQVYWAGLPYYGFGPGAARYLQGRRQLNHRSVTTWLKRIEAGASPIGEEEELSPEDRARELIVLGLRRNAGIDRRTFRVQTGFDLEMLAAEPIRRHVEHGWLESTPEHLRLTREGRFVADSIIVDFL